MTILEFIESPRYLGDKDLSHVQRVILKAIYGLALEERELATFHALSGGKSPRKGGWDVVSLGCGRRSGKTEKIAANIAAYESVTFDERQLSPGEVAYCIIVAQNQKQARICRDYIEAKLHKLEANGHSVLAKTPGQMKAITADEIRLINQVVIATFPCKKVAVRGVTCFCFIADEIGHWQVEEDAYNADIEVIRAIRPAMATVKRRKLIKISTPFIEAGVFHDDWRNRERTRQLVIHEIPTELMNPSVPKTFLAEEQLADPDSYQREYLAKWSGVGGNFISGDLVDACTEPGLKMRPYSSGHSYIAWIDAAFKRDLFAFAIGHREETVVLMDRVLWWKPPHPKRPLQMEPVVAEIAGECKEYRCDRVRGDQFADVPLRQELQKHGLGFVEKPVTLQSKYEVFRNLKAALLSKRVALLDEPMLKRDLTSLEAHKTQGGMVRVAAPRLRGYHDDLSHCVGGIVNELLDMRSHIDIAEMNRAAMPQPHYDWREAENMRRDEKVDPIEEDIMGAIF